MEKGSSAPSDPTISVSSISPERLPPPSPSPHAPNSPPPDAQSSSSQLNRQFAANFSALYHSIFPPKSPRTSSTVISPSQCSSAPSDNHQDASISRSAVALEHRLNQARLVLEYQQLRDHYDLCRAHLTDLTEEIDSLRREMARLRMTNAELVKLLNLPSQATVQNCLRRLGLIDNNAAGSEFSCEDFCSYSPTSVMDQSGYDTSNPERVWLPKSISVRSSGYLKLNQPASSNSRPARATCQLRMPKDQEQQQQQQQQRLYLPADSKKEQEALEFEVYSQGMFKTELCNKWQETGACPYGDHCQFAHGIAELRPVIRHPRYKTEVCRMVLSGDTCPYGHRCHFRHSLTEQELMLLAPR